MEREAVVTGYCRQTDQSRIVTVEAEDNRLTDTDCLFTDCPYNAACAVAQKIRNFLGASEEQRTHQPSK